MRPLDSELRKRYSSAIRMGFIDPDRPQMHSFCGTWVRKHPNRTSTLARLREILGHDPEWEDITDDTLSDLKYDMDDQLAPNSVRTICAELAAVLSSNRRTKPIKSEAFGEILKAKRTPTTAVYLTKDELNRIHEYRPEGTREDYVREMFMRECLTGARAVDCRRLTPANLHSTPDGDCIVYVAQKHPVEVRVPVGPRIREYLHTNWPESVTCIRTDHLNETLRAICEKCGIDREVTIFHAGKYKTGPKYRFVSSHTGRRTFATLRSNDGLPIGQIAMTMGHMTGNVPNTDMTARYICDRQVMSPQDERRFRASVG